MQDVGCEGAAAVPKPSDDEEDDIEALRERYSPHHYLLINTQYIYCLHKLFARRSDSLNQGKKFYSN